MYYLLSNNSLEDIDFRMSKGYLTDIMLNLGSNFSITSLEKLKEVVREFLDIKGYNYSIANVPYSILYEMYSEGYLAEVVKPIAVKKEPTPRNVHHFEFFEEFYLFRNMQARNLNVNFNQIFIEFSRRYSRISLKKDRSRYLKTLFYREDNETLDVNNETIYRVGRIFLNAQFDRYFDSIENYKSIRYQRSRIVRAYKDYKNIDFYKIALSRVNIANSNKLGDIQLEFNGVNNTPNFFNGFTIKEVFDYFVLYKDDNNEYDEYQQESVNVFNTILNDNGLSMNEPSPSAMKLYSIIKKSIDREDTSNANSEKQDFMERIRNYIFNAKDIPLDEYETFNDFKDFSITFDGIEIELKS